MADSGRTPVLFMLLSFVLLGVLLRVAGGSAIISSNLIYSAGVKQEAPGAGTPEDAAESFYLLIDQGEYAKAWELALEPSWTGADGATYRTAVQPSPSSFPGWTPREQFIQRLTDELGAGGIWLKLNDIQAGAAAFTGSATDLPTALGAGLGAEQVVSVRVSGNMLGACTIFHWEKDLPVARIGGQYKVVLPGTKPAGSLFYQSWFADLRQIGTLRGSAP